LSRFGGKATGTPGAVPAFVGRGFAGRGSGRHVVGARCGPRFRGFAGRGSGRGVVVPPVQTEVSRFRGEGVGSRCRCSAGSDRGFEVPAGGDLGAGAPLGSRQPSRRCCRIGQQTGCAFTTYYRADRRDEPGLGDPPTCVAFGRRFRRRRTTREPPPGFLGPCAARRRRGYGCPAALLDGVDTAIWSFRTSSRPVVCDSCVVLLRDVELSRWNGHPRLHGH
jgi:hypothetical protein